ncbi:E3 ubiquitin-protein ligase MARCHF3 [Myxocyprinus asiaticus]|uniref:E3 ubiquitin-protein ligase MARCHF3 n=1 Tax=Myxocyprinus asiaticus TaxID=70543 RepID=UPI002223B7F9|nr:E3 ubiquitin-protein ligase MARCHF3 [Myxocyprinus asiaticus]
MAPWTAVMLCEESSEGFNGGPGPEVLVKADAETAIDPVKEVIHSSTYISSVFLEHGGNSLNGEEPFCRICHEGSSAGDLLSPCECAGSLAMVHRVCLEHWLTASGTSHCELCHFEFSLERLPKPLIEWFTTPSMQHQRRTLCGDAICFLFITPLASLSGWLCVQGAMDLYYSNGIEAIGLIVLTLTLFTIYFFWTVVSIRYHIHLIRTWNATNPCVRLQIPCPAKTPKRPKNVVLHFLCKNKKKETVV